MRSRRVTSSDVARHAGVSRTTVSFVLNNVPGMAISEETRQRVLQSARELGYIPDAAARMLASGQSKTLGLIIRNACNMLFDAYVPQILFSLQSIARQHQFRLLVETVDQTDSSDVYTTLAHAKEIDGLIFFNAQAEEPGITQLLDDGYPVVLLDAYPHPNACSVEIDSVRWSKVAVSHLIQLGHTRIGFINYAAPPSLGAMQRLFGYQAALREANLPFDERLIRFADGSAEGGYTAMRDMLSSGFLPSALFAGNDTIAIGVLAAIHEAGLRVPQNIAVIGFDDLPIAKWTMPSLTTIRTPALEIGRWCGKLLIQLIRGEVPASRRILVEAELIVRASCGARR